jgi:hypothetical protein
MVLLGVHRRSRGSVRTMQFHLFDLPLNLTVDLLKR